MSLNLLFPKRKCILWLPCPCISIVHWVWGRRVDNVILVHRSLDHDDLHPDLMQMPRIAHPLEMPDLELDAVTGWEFKSFPLERC